MVGVNLCLAVTLVVAALLSSADGMSRRPRCVTQKKGECVEKENCRSTGVIPDEHPILSLCPKQRKGGDLVCCASSGVKTDAGSSSSSTGSAAAASSSSSSGSSSSSSGASSSSSSSGASKGRFGGNKASGSRASSSSEECQPQPDKEKTLCQTKHRGVCIPDDQCEHLVSGNVNHEDACPDSEDLVCCNPRNSTSTCASQSGVCMSWCANELRRSGTGCSSSCPMCCVPIG